MPYLGRGLEKGNYLKLDDISSQFDGSKTTFNLTVGGSAHVPGSSYSLLVSLSGIVQEGEAAYTLDQNEITFAAAPQAADDCFIISLGTPLGIGVPSNGTVNGTQLAKPLNYDNFFHLDHTNDRVGIGTSLPTQSLDVYDGNIAIRDPATASQFLGFYHNRNVLKASIDKTGNNLTFENVDSGIIDYKIGGDSRVSIGSTGKIFFGTDDNTYFYRPGADTLGFLTGGTERLRITSGGEVLIGTTTDANVKLDVEGSLRAKSAGYVAPASGTGLEIYYATNTLNDAPSGYLISYDRSSSAYKKINYDASEHRLRISGTERLHIGSTGISTFTNDVRIVKSGGPLLELTTNTGSADATLRLSEGTPGSTTNGGGMFYSGADNKLHITCGTNSTTKRITIQRDDGKVGIGTHSPTSKLTVSGGSIGSGAIDALELKHVSANNSGDGTSLLFNAVYDNNPWAYAKINAVNSGTGFGGDLQVHIHPADGTQGSSVVQALSIVGDGSSGAVVRIPNGKVGIGTDNPSTKVHIYDASADPYLRIGGSGRDCGIQLDAATNFTAFRTDAANRLYVNAGGDTIRFSIGGTGNEKLRIKNDGKTFIHGVGATGANNTATLLPNGYTLNIHGTSSNDGISVVRYSADYGAYGLNIGKSNNSTFGTNTLVTDGEELGHISFYGADGTDFNMAAQITGEVDGTPSDGTDMPGALIFKTSSESSGTPTERLRIANDGQITQTAASGDTIITLKRSDTNTTGLTGGINFAASDGHSVASIQARGDGNNEGAHLQFYTTTAAAGDMFNAANVERLRIKSDGTITLNNNNLELSGPGSADSTAFDNAAWEKLVFAPQYSDAARGPNKIVLQNDTGGGGWFAGFGIHTNTLAIYSGGDTVFHQDSRNSNHAGNFRMIIKEDGKVGIGEDDPQKLLHLTGADTAVILLENSDTSLGQDQLIGGFEWKKNDASGSGIGTVGAIKVRSDDSYGARSYMSFSIRRNSTGEANIDEEFVRLTSGGRLRVRCEDMGSDPGTSNRGVLIGDTSSGCVFSNGSSTGFSNNLIFMNGNGVVGKIETNGSNTNYNESSSDRTLKKNFENWTEEVLPNFKNLNPQKFNFLPEDDSVEKTKGFIAQDLAEHFPRAYPLDPLTGKYNYNPSGMVVYLMKALQEEIVKREALEARISALEGS